MKRSDPSDGIHVVLGASPDSTRYAYLAVERLLEYGYRVAPVGIRPGNISGTDILLYPAKISNVHTVTLYVNPDVQRTMYDYILGLNPKRIIFNPGSENSELAALAESKGIATEEGCSLVLLRTGQY